MRIVILLALFWVVVGCRSIEPQEGVDTSYARSIYEKLSEKYPKAPPEPERSTSEVLYDTVRFPLLYVAGVGIYLPVVASFEEGPAGFFGFSSTIYGDDLSDRWSDWWYEHNQRWDVWADRTDLVK